MPTAFSQLREHDLFIHDDKVWSKVAERSLHIPSKDDGTKLNAIGEAYRKPNNVWQLWTRAPDACFIEPDTEVEPVEVQFFPLGNYQTIPRS